MKRVESEECCEKRYSDDYLKWGKAKVSGPQKKYRRSLDRNISNNIFSQFPSHFPFIE